jgi:CRP-like cAMP-binding protein
MNDDDRSARLLREVFLAGFMSGLPAEDLALATARLAAAMDDVRLQEGEVLYREGELPAEHYFVVRGEVKLETPGAPTWTLGDRALVGTLDVTIGRPRSRTATATRDTHLLRQSAGDWLDMLEDNFEMTRAGVQGLAAGVHRLRLELGRIGPEHDGARSISHTDARRLDLVERVFALRKVDLFTGADVQALMSLAEIAREVEFAPGEAVFARGGSNEALVLVLAGQVTVSDAESTRRDAFGPYELVLGSAAVSAEDLGYQARADTAVRVLRIGHEDYFDVMEEHFLLARSAMKALAIERELLMNERGRRAASASPEPNAEMT